MKKYFAIIILFSSYITFYGFCFAQTSQETNEKNNSEAKIEGVVNNNSNINTENISKEIQNTSGLDIEDHKISPFPFAFYIDSLVTLSAPDEKNTPTVSPSINAGMEYEYRILKHFYFSPSLDLSLLHYGLKNSKAYICEIENRTALTFNMFVDFPLLAGFDINSWNIAFGGGIAFLVRFGMLDIGVDPNQNSHDGSLSAKEEVKGINSYFWQNGRFFRPSLQFKFSYTFSSGWRTGLQTRLFFPIANLWDNTHPKFADDLAIQIGIIIYPARKL